MRVLLADDDPVIRALVCAVLAGLGHEPVTVADGAAAWAAFQQAPTPLAVLDLEMPRLGGVELCRRIRASDPLRETLIVVLTGRDQPGDLAAVLDAGADDYMTKPASAAHLRARLQIAERRLALEEARRRAEAELARARWLAGIGETTIALQHQINNPLSALMGHVELLRMELEDRGERSEGLEIIQEQARRIADVVQRIAQLRNPRSVPYVGGTTMIDLNDDG